MEKERAGFVRVKVCACLFVSLTLTVAAACLMAGSRLPDTVGRTLTDTERREIIDRNSCLVDYVYLSPNADFPRTDTIRKITVHHMADDLKLDNLGYVFAERDRNASSNYAIDVDGNVALYVEESDRAWTSSSRDNDAQAVTIEVANDEIGGEWHVSDESFDALVDLCVDICRRNGMDSLVWTGGPDGTLTVHSMFSETTECPGPYLLGCMPELAELVNMELASGGRDTDVSDAVDEEGGVKPVNSGERMVALTFDDGPDGTWTGAILDVLEEYDAAATFFVIGENVEAYPDVVGRMAEMGCEVGSHGYDDGHLTELSVDELAEKLGRTDAAIVDAGAPVPGLLRAAGGWTDHTVRRNAGKAVVGWTVDPRDWETRDAASTVEHIKNFGDLDGQVVLLHSLYESSAEAVEELVPWLIDHGYKLVTVSELLESYYGEQPRAGTYYSNRYFSMHVRQAEPAG